MAQASFWKRPFHFGRRNLAKAWIRLHSQATTIGLTGSYGKTSTTRAVAAVLSEKFPTLQTDLNLDTVYNLPITLLKLRSKHKFLVLELGVDHRGEMDSYLKLVKPTIGIVTGISPVHSDPELLGSVEGIKEEKGKLLEALPKNGWAILNRDDGNVYKMAQKTKAKILWYGLGEKNDFWADNIKIDLDGTVFDLHYREPLSKKEKLLRGIKIPLLGQHFVSSALAAWAVGIICGLDEKEIISGLAKLQPLSGRMSLEKGPLGTTILDDHLRANPASTLAGLKTFEALSCPSTSRGRKIAVLGEMGELGKYAKEEHRKIGEKMADFSIDCLVGIGPLQKLVIDEAVKGGFAKDRVFWAGDVREASNFLKSYIKNGDFIYLKGSLLRHLERIILILKGQKVSCDLVSCHRYQPCQTCPKLSKVS